MQIKTWITGLVAASALVWTNMAKAQEDWADLGRFKNADKELGTPKPGESRVVFMGNSITIGWLNQRPEFFADRPFINRGISGQTTPQMLLRFRQDVLDIGAQVVVILAGTNDIAGNTGPTTLEEISGNIQSMAELAQVHGIAVVLCSVLPAYDYPWRPGMGPDKKIPELNDLIKAYAERHGIVYVDYFSAMADSRNGLPKNLAKDGVHPTPEGYSIMEPLVEKGIAEALQKR